MLVTTAAISDVADFILPPPGSTWTAGWSLVLPMEELLPWKKI